MDSHKNFATSTVATAPSPAASGTSLVVTAGEGVLFPSVPFNAVVCPAGIFATSANAEIVRVTAISTDTFTITRQQESTSARTILAGDQIYNAATNKVFTDIEATLPTNRKIYLLLFSAYNRCEGAFQTAIVSDGLRCFWCQPLVITHDVAPYFAKYGRLGPGNSPIGVSQTMRIETPVLNSTAAQHIAVLNGVWIIGASSTGIHFYRSADRGNTWTPIFSRDLTDSPWGDTGAGPGGDVSNVAVFNGQFIALKETGGSLPIATSVDGLIWTYVGSSHPNSNYANSLSYNGSSIYVLSAPGISSGVVYSSPDLVTWTSRTCFTTGLVKTSSNTCYGGSVFMAIGSETASPWTVRAATSANGTTWTEVGTLFNGTSATFSRWCDKLVYGNGVWIATFKTTNSLYWVSTDNGVNWTSYTPPGSFPIVPMNVTFANGYFGCCNAGGSNVYSSLDGVTWTDIGNLNPSTSLYSLLGDETVGTSLGSIRTVQLIDGDWIVMSDLSGPGKLITPNSVGDLKLCDGIDVKVVEEDSRVHIYARGRHGGSISGIYLVCLGSTAI